MANGVLQWRDNVELRERGEGHAKDAVESTVTVVRELDVGGLHERLTVDDDLEMTLFADLRLRGRKISNPKRVETVESLNIGNRPVVVATSVNV